MYIHFSIFQFIAPLGSLYVLVPEVIFDDLSKLENIKHLKKVLLYQNLNTQDDDLYLIGQDKRILKCNNYLFFDFPSRQINVDALKKEDGFINLSLFLNIFPVVPVVGSNLSNIEFTFIGSSNYRINKFDTSDSKFEIYVTSDEVETSLFLYGALIKSVNNKELKEKLREGTFSISEFSSLYPKTLNDIVLENYTMFL